MIDSRRECKFIRKTALENGFKLKKQPSGETDLNPYVFDFAEKLLAEKKSEIAELKQKLEKLESGEFTLIENKKLTTWYLDEPEGMYWDFDGIDGAFSNLDGGQVIKVERLRNFTVPEVYVTRTWEDGDVGYWKEYATKEEAEKVAKHCKAMIEAVEKDHE